MSLYNMMHGVTQATFYILPMLGKHPDEYPRFRDCFTEDDEHPEYDNYIHVYTRTGGGNRELYYEQNREMQLSENFIIDFDDDFDNTFASWVFSVPEKWKADYDNITQGKKGLISEEYIAELKRVYPKLVEKLDKIFSSAGGSNE